MHLELTKILQSQLQESAVERVSDSIINYIVAVENAITRAKEHKNWLTALGDLFSPTLQLVIDIKSKLPDLSKDEIVEIVRRVFVFVYDNVFIPIDLPISDSIEVALEQVGKPILERIVVVSAKYILTNLLKV